MIDTHCHIDLYQNPFEIINECEKACVTTIGMTNLPSHFELGYIHVRQCKKVRLALGMHPLYACRHGEEYSGFINNLSKTSYIGEIGLDFSKEGIATKDIQLNSFINILGELKGKKKILSLHSRGAETEVLDLLIKNNVESAIFHWYSGSLKLIDEIVKAGYFFSVNPAMIKSLSGQKIIKKIPKEKILTESDGPFILENKLPIRPVDVRKVLVYLSGLWNITYKQVEDIIDLNFNELLNVIK